MHMAYFRLLMVGINLKVMDSHHTSSLSCFLLKQKLLPLVLCVGVYSRKPRKCLPLIDSQSLKCLGVKFKLFLKNSIRAMQIKKYNKLSR